MERGSLTKKDYQQRHALKPLYNVLCNIYRGIFQVQPTGVTITHQCIIRILEDEGRNDKRNALTNREYW